MNSLFVVGKHLRGYDKGFALDEFLLVGDMALHCEGGAGRLLDVLRGNAESVPQRIDPEIERQDIVGNIHVAIDINPLGQHRTLCNRFSKHFLILGDSHHSTASSAISRK